MLRLLFVLVLVAGFVVPTQAQTVVGCEQHVRYGAPSDEEIILCRLGYALSYDTEHKVADWVAYHLDRDKVRGQHPRKDNFQPDQDVPVGARSEPKDYKGSGFDRGHMVPAAAMKWSPQAMSESFLLTNMAPQVGNGFNRHIWARLERHVREWASERGDLYVVTGPVYDPGPLKKIGDNKISVPSHFYKVIFDPTRVEAIAFTLPNKSTPTSELPSFINTVDEVETKTGLDFLSELSDQVETLVESARAEAMW
jgi:endonuclease G